MVSFKLMLSFATVLVVMCISSFKLGRFSGLTTLQPASSPGTIAPFLIYLSYLSYLTNRAVPAPFQALSSSIIIMVSFKLMLSFATVLVVMCISSYKLGSQLAVPYTGDDGSYGSSTGGGGGGGDRPRGGGKQPFMRIVSNRWKEDIMPWVSRLDTRIPVYVQNKGPEFSQEMLVTHPQITEHSISNIGRECDGFLRYIVENYDNLANLTVFVHGDPPAQYHSKPDIIGEINKVYKDHVGGQPFSGYLSLNYIYVFRCMDEQVDFCCKLDRAHMNQLWEIFYPVGSEYRMPSKPPACIQAPCCAQFVVSREMIHRFSFKTWKKMLFWIQERGHEYYACYALEHFWHLVFGEQPVMQGVPEEILNTKYDLVRAFLQEWPDQTCEVETWKARKDKGEGTPMYDKGMVPCKPKSQHP
eukprot:TRINITY_DN3032_c0_g1_i1.p1 TRINITY_DN3032_c0_g1~~TRINITY_DN3032_c0_g1_i1.p1  ORF type:complete len:473 (-),score=60.62 TRINITY_DN3032_c0_g1_i1:102-1343(-)